MILLSIIKTFWKNNKVTNQQLLKIIDEKSKDVIFAGNPTTKFIPPKDSSGEKNHEYVEKEREQHFLERKDTHNLRLIYTARIYWLVCVWLSFIIIAVFFQGFAWVGFRLSDNVLMPLLLRQR